MSDFQSARHDVGNPTEVVLATGDRITHTYDETYRLTREQRSGTGAYDITYTFDASGNRTTKLAAGATTTFTYNGMDQLTVANAAGVLTSYTFDASGNNTVVDADGTLTTYTWDLANRMRVAALPSAEVVTLLYDPTGLRRSRQDASGTTAFLWDGQSLLEERVGGSTEAHYTVAPGGFGPVISQRRGAASRFFHPNDLGTIEALTDADENVTDTYVLDAWGVSHASSGSTVNPFQYIGALGYYREPDLDLSYVRARWLRPTTAGWLSVDPVASEPRYQYVGGRVATGTDGSGERSPTWAGECHPAPAHPHLCQPFPVRPDLGDASNAGNVIGAIGDIAVLRPDHLRPPILRSYWKPSIGSPARFPKRLPVIGAPKRPINPGVLTQGGKAATVVEVGAGAVAGLALSIAVPLMLCAEGCRLAEEIGLAGCIKVFEVDMDAAWDWYQSCHVPGDFCREHYALRLRDAQAGHDDCVNDLTAIYNNCRDLCNDTWIP